MLVTTNNPIQGGILYLNNDYIFFGKAKNLGSNSVDSVTFRQGENLVEQKSKTSNISRNSLLRRIFYKISRGMGA